MWHIKNTAGLIYLARAVIGCQVIIEHGNAIPATGDLTVCSSTGATGTWQTTAITNVRIFDGTRLLPAGTVVISGGQISRVCVPSDDNYDECVSWADKTISGISSMYDAEGMTLLPGFIDAHTHPDTLEHMHALTTSGVTTTMLAACPDPAFCASLANHAGVAQLITASLLATSGNSSHAKFALRLGPEYLIDELSHVPAWVERQISQGADIIKVIGAAPQPGLGQAAQALVVSEAKRRGRDTVIHAASYDSFWEAATAGASQIHHSTLDRAADEALVELLRGAGSVLCPTLTMMRAVVENLGLPPQAYKAAELTVAAMHAAGVPVIVGTDANLQAMAPANVQFGSSFHDEMENLVALGMAPVAVLQAATATAARAFGLGDRGVVKEGKKADLVLVRGDPTVEISATRDIVKIWAGGLEVR